MQFPSGDSPQVPQSPQVPPQVQQRQMPQTPQASQAHRAVVSPPVKAGNDGMVSSFKFSAGGGLLAGIVAGFVLLSGASEPAKEVNATKRIEAKTVAVMGDNTGPELVESETVGSNTPPLGAATNVEKDPSNPELIDPDTLVPTLVPTPEAATPEAATPEAPEAATPEAATPEAATPEVDSPTKYSVMFQIRPAILRDTISIEVDGAPYNIQSFYSLALKPGHKSQKIRVTATAEGYRDFKDSQVIRRDDQFIIQMKEKPAIAATVVKVSKPKTTKPKTTKPRKPRTAEPRKPRKPRTPKPKGPGSLISL